jgi:hypothetical protein
MTAKACWRSEGRSRASSAGFASGVLHNTRGCITLLDRAALEARSCERSGIAKREFDRMLPGTRQANVFV